MLIFVLIPIGKFIEEKIALRNFIFCLMFVLSLAILAGCSADPTQDSKTVAIDCGGESIFIAQEEEKALSGEFFNIVANGGCVVRGGNLVLSDFSSGKSWYEPILFRNGERISIPDTWKLTGEVIFRKE